MALTTLLAATDATPGGRHAVRTAAQIARAADARLVVLMVRPPEGNGRVAAAGTLLSSRDPRQHESGALGELRAWLGSDEPEGAEVVLAFGVAGVEIARLARQRGADLIVIGRHPRGPAHPLELGETADALVRRSDVPVLSVPPQVERLDSALFALDGTKRSSVVLDVGMRLAPVLGVHSARVVTVEAPDPDDAGDPAHPTGRSLQLGRSLERHRLADAGSTVALSVRHGRVVEEVLAEAEEHAADLLVIGYRRGGPPRLVGPSEIARNLLYAAPTAVLTVPL